MTEEVTYALRIFVNISHTVIFFGRNLFEMGESAQLRFALKNFGRISSIAQPKNLLNWGNFAQIERNSPESFGAKLNCAGSPISGEKNNYCAQVLVFSLIKSKKKLTISYKFCLDLCDLVRTQKFLKLAIFCQKLDDT
jgi:hypothetical protein